jgi:hypothetical protein
MLWFQPTIFPRRSVLEQLAVARHPELLPIPAWPLPVWVLPEVAVIQYCDSCNERPAVKNVHLDAPISIPEWWLCQECIDAEIEAQGLQQTRGE